VKEEQQQQRKNCYLYSPAGFAGEAFSHLRGDLDPMLARYMDIQLFENGADEPSLEVWSPLDHFDRF
jgi:hypothetical protein